MLAIAQGKRGVTDFAAEAGVNRTTLYALINPSQHPRRRGGVPLATAWKLAKAHAAATDFKEEQAFEKMLAEEEVVPVAA